METKQYKTVVFCQISHAEEEVFFHEVQFEGSNYLKFDGCDHQFHACSQCEDCRHTAYKNLTANNK